MFDDLGCQILTRNRIKDVVKNDKVVIHSIKHDGLYYMVGSSEMNVTDSVVKHGDLPVYQALAFKTYSH